MAWQGVLLCLFVTLLMVTVHGDDTEDTPTTTTQKPTTTTKTTPKTTTTTATTTTTTTATTTTKSTTTAQTTTKHPTTTMMPPASTTPPPSERPAVGTYYVKADNGTNCVLLSAGIRLWFTYDNSSTKPNATRTNNTVFVDVTDLPLPATQVNGLCSNNTQSITVPFKVDGNDWNVTMVFNRTKNDIKLIETTVDFTMTKKIFPDAFMNTTVTSPYHPYHVAMVNQSLMETPKGQGFRCGSNNTIPFTVKSPLTKVETRKLEVEAYRTKNTTKFEKEYTQCEQDNNISNIVPIAVGAALGALVLIVLIAYLVGRKRNQRGYESV